MESKLNRKGIIAMRGEACMIVAAGVDTSKNAVMTRIVAQAKCAAMDYVKNVAGIGIAMIVTYAPTTPVRMAIVNIAK